MCCFAGVARVGAAQQFHKKDVCAAVAPSAIDRQISFPGLAIDAALIERVIRQARLIAPGIAKVQLAWM